MKYFITFFENGDIDGFYIEGINENIPEDAMEVSEEEWKQYSLESWKYKLDGDKIREKTEEELKEIFKPLPPADLDILGMQLVEKDLEIIDLQKQNEALGKSLVNLELRLLALEGGKIG